MKSALVFFALAMAISTVVGEMQCADYVPDLPTAWIDMEKSCSNAMRRQIQMEIHASYIYLAMGAHFSRDTINRPGFAELFFHSAKEERSHGQKLIEYLSMRGLLANDITGLITVPTVDQQDWQDVASALSDALELETKLTKSFHDLIKTCEKGKVDHHLIHQLTGVYLEHKLTKQRELAGKLSALKKMMKNHGAISEFWFDINNYGTVNIKVGSPSLVGSSKN